MSGNRASLFSPTRLALGFLLLGREIVSGSSGIRRGTGSPSSCAQFPQHRASTPSLWTSVPKAPGFLEKNRFGNLGWAPQDFSKNDFSGLVWSLCGHYMVWWPFCMDLCGFVVSIWFHVLSIWCHVVHVWPHVVLSGLYVVSCGFYMVLCGF